jgi:membrane protease YdiL (CAAX protease family)
VLVVVRAVLTGTMAAAAGTVPWAVLAGANLKLLPGVPWAAPVMALYLWVYWRHMQRRADLRARPLTEEAWATALFAGGLGLMAVVLLLGVLNRLVRLPQQQLGADVSQVPFLTLASLVAMGSVAAGVVEEASFRGCMQAPIERRHGPVVAILVTSGLFGLAHFTHRDVTLLLMPYYMAVGAIYGSLAYLTNSILPSLVLHAAGNIWVALDFFARGQSEWQASATPAPLIWETGPDAPFWLQCAAVVLVGAAALWAFRGLAALQELQAARNRSANCAPLPASSCLKNTNASRQGSAWTRSAQPFRSASE